MDIDTEWGHEVIYLLGISLFQERWLVNISVIHPVGHRTMTTVGNEKYFLEQKCSHSTKISQKFKLNLKN